MSGPEQAQHERERLSALLRQLRGHSGLSGASAATVAGFSQSKLSKIETGLLLPSPSDAAALCSVYGASDRQWGEVRDLVDRLRDEVESNRVILQRGAYRKQQEIGRIEAEASLLRGFQLGYIPGLLQTQAYMAKVFEQTLSSLEARDGASARAARQNVLADPAKEFRFLLTEGALRWRAGGASLMKEQLDRLLALSAVPNVRLGVIPWSAQVTVFPNHAFHVYDDRIAIVGTLTATATIRSPRDVKAYVDLFVRLEQAAVFDDAARSVLAKIRRAHASAR